MMDDVVRNLRVLWRAETIIADIRFRQVAIRSGLKGIAALLVAFAFLMGNLAAFFALEQVWGPIWAAAIIALASLAVAALLLLVAARAKPGREMELALEVRNAALQALEVDALALQKQVIEVREEIRGVRQAITGFARHPFDSLLPSLLVPLAGAVVKGLKKTDEGKA
ncbi:MULTISPECIES: phage holin family protein [Microvirga]|uniref:phage holin family protein n=1 Tax=Microvirga TaxID=186650 RepID=UPI001D00100A|nr:phage holin family protein [Microvirga lenta]MCB5175665.1 phage holin family protein [Microvirga lenta]